MLLLLDKMSLLLMGNGMLLLDKMPLLLMGNRMLLLDKELEVEGEQGSQERGRDGWLAWQTPARLEWPVLLAKEGIG